MLLTTTPDLVSVAKWGRGSGVRYVPQYEQILGEFCTISSYEAENVVLGPEGFVLRPCPSS